jgi:hypothetical protein
MTDEIERRKDTIRRVWDYKRVDHIPIMMRVGSNPWDYTTREHFLDADKQFQIEIESVKLSLEMVPDDICAQFSPEFFNRFSKPFNNRIFARFGGGMLHNCGPNPCASEYLRHDPPIKAVDLA